MSLDPRTPVLVGVGAVTQQVDDPRQVKPYRDVVRRLVPLEGDR